MDPAEHRQNPPVPATAPGEADTAGEATAPGAASPTSPTSGTKPTSGTNPTDAAPRGRQPRGPGRRPGQSETREAILAAALSLFADKGYDGASVRAIARGAAVDPALVHHFFGTKEGVFIEAMRFPVDPSVLLPRVTAVPRERLGETMARTFLEVWATPDRRAPILGMLRSAMTNERAAALMREFLTSALFARAGAALDVPQLRIQAAAGQMIGMMIVRYVLCVEPLASASEDELVELVAPVLQRYLG